MQYLVSFCGYFPSDNPKYSCIVAIQKPGLPASGGLMAGSVFSEIAERVYAKHLAQDLKEAKDSTAILTPDVKQGDRTAARYVLNEIGHADMQIAPSPSADGKRVPNVKGMGAKDAVYLLESLGLKVHLTGMGKVRSQSIAAGNTLVKGKTIQLKLQ